MGLQFSYAQRIRGEMGLGKNKPKDFFYAEFSLILHACKWNKEGLNSDSFVKFAQCS